MRAYEQDDRYPEGGVTREQTVEGIAQALFARHQDTTWDRGIQDYRDQAEYLLTHADAQDWEHAHGRPSYLTPVGTPPRKSRREDNPRMLAAIQWLTDALEEGPQDSNRLRRAAYEEENISGATLRRAREALGIRPKLRAGRWMWEMPTTESAEEAVSVTSEESALEDVSIVPAIPAQLIVAQPARIQINASMSEDEIREVFKKHGIGVKS
jgi:hypothetical protein